MCCLFVISFTSCASIPKNQKTESYNISGNCGMCEETIETAGSVKGISEVDWDRNTKKASISYDAKKTSSQEILKKIALAGYDNEAFIAPDASYSKLPGCCQYPRKFGNNKTVPADNNMASAIEKEELNESKVQESQNPSRQLQALFDNYILLKDALVNSDGAQASLASKLLLENVNSIKMSTLSEAEHRVWMKITNDLKKDVELIAKTTNVERQRAQFGALSDTMFELIKVAKLNGTIYYQHCPMANDGEGSNWLSTESTIKNPFYGAKMLSCGKTIETIEN